MNEDFETAVVDALVGLARVDQSTTEQVRASIALLPDQRSRAEIRLRRSQLGFSPRRWPRVLALAGAMLVVVAVVAISVFGAPRPRPVGTNTPATAVATPSANSSASPSVMPTPSPIWTGPAYGETLPVLLTGNNVSFAGWSPDGSRYAIVDDATDSAAVHLFDRSGTEVDTVDGVGMFGFAWLDANRFVVITSEDRVNHFAGPLDAFMGRVGSTLLTNLGQYDSLLAGPSGSIALMQTLNWDPSVPNSYMKSQYAVVSADGSVSKPREGLPQAWSRDGSMLAVYHATALAAAPSGMVPPTLGSLEVVRSTGKSVISTHGTTFAWPYGAAFSPDGARLAFGYKTEPISGTEQTAVLEIATGHVTIVAESGPMTWASNDQLLIVYTSTDYGKTPSAIRAWSVKTGLVTTYAPGDTVSASGRGTVVAGSDTTHIFTWTITTGGSTRTGTFSLGYSLGAGTWIPDSAWSPDGSSLILTVGNSNGLRPMDAVLFRP